MGLVKDNLFKESVGGMEEMFCLMRWSEGDVPVAAPAERASKLALVPPLAKKKVSSPTDS